MLATSRITEVEVRRNLARVLDDAAAGAAKRQLLEDLDVFALVAVDATTCSDAARVAESTMCRSLHAIHIAASRFSNNVLDLRHSPGVSAARSAGLAVIGT